VTARTVAEALSDLELQASTEASVGARYASPPMYQHLAMLSALRGALALHPFREGHVLPIGNVCPLCEALGRLVTP
jgi:hypothetical protein